MHMPEKKRSLPSTKKELPFRELFRILYENAGDARALIPLHSLLLLIDALIQAFIPAIFGFVVDQLVKNPSGFVQDQLPWMAGVSAVGAVAFYVIALLQHYLGQKIAAKALVNTQASLYRHLQRLGADFFQRTHVGEITARLTNDTSAGVQQVYLQGQYIFWILMLLVSALVIMATLNWKMLLVFMVVTAMMATLSSFVLPYLRRLYREARDELGKINARMTEDVSSISLIQAFASENMHYEEIKRLCAGFLEKSLRSRRIGVLFSDIINTFMVIIGPLSLLYIGALMVDEDFTVASLVAFFAYWRVAAGPTAQVINQIASLFGSLASLDRVVEFFKESPSIEDRPDAKEIEVKGKISFEDVTFCYPGVAEESVLKNVDFTIEPAQSFAIVGESGAGKSTVTNLLLRFYAATEGRVCIDSHDILDLKQENFRRQIGLVMQETIILSGSVRQNMLLAKPEASEEEIVNALQQAEAWEFVQALPDKLETVLGERGVRLSGGQRQRLAIARVLLRNPPVVILDEATSALDSVTERSIQATMNRLFTGRTWVVIAHRLSTIIDCDRIMVLDKGRVVGLGSHRELFESCRQYRLLCSKQGVGLDADHT